MSWDTLQSVHVGVLKENSTIFRKIIAVEKLKKSKKSIFSGKMEQIINFL